MRRTTTFIVLLGLCFSVPGSLAFAQGNNPPDVGAKSATKSATAAEVEQLRHEVAELRAIVQRLVEASGHQGSSDPHFMLAKAVVAAPKNSNGAAAADVVLPAGPDPTAEASPAEPSSLLQGEKKDQKTAAAPVLAGFNGEHFFVKSADGKFQIQPYGYVQTDYRAYTGDGAPPNTFTIRRGRFGFLGTYGKNYDFAILADAAATSGSIIRDIYLQAKPYPWLQFQVGQFKEPFAQEELTAVTNTDFVERALTVLLYPSAATAFRSPGAVIHGDIAGGAMQYWVGAFNGKGIGATNTTSEPEVLGRLRFYPWKKSSNEWVKGFAFGGAIGHGRSRGLSNETSFSGAMPDAAYTFFPSFRLNGPVERYNGEFTWIKGPWALRGEYVQLNQARNSVGSEIVDGADFLSVPGVVAKAGYIYATYLLTGEARPENGVPKVKHPMFGPETPGGTGTGKGAWELKFRYSGIQAKALGANFPNPFTPARVPTFEDHTDQFTVGLNWYPNYWIKYQLDFNVDRLKDPSVQGILPQKYYVVLQRVQFRF